MISEYHVRPVPVLADVIVRRLGEVGTRMLFGVPGGGGNLDLIEAAGRAGLPFVLTATETGGALAAMAQAEVTGRPGACLTTLGPGASSVANGVACALLDRAPLLVFTDSYAAGASAFQHQRFDHQALFKPITKWSGRLSPECAARTLDQAFAAVLDLPPGPIHVDCPGEIGTLEMGTVLSTAAERRRNVSFAPVMSAQFKDLVRRARKPLIVVGLGARQPDDAAAIRGLLEQRRVPGMVTYKAKGVIPDRHPCFAGVFTHALLERPLIEASDLIVGIGLDPVELLPRPWTYEQPAIYVGPWNVADSHVPFASRWVSDIPSGVEALEALLTDSEWSLDDVRTRAADARAAADVPTSGLSAQRVVSIAAERFPAHARVTVDAGAHMIPATLLWPMAEPNQMLISNGLSTMGFALPAAIGAALLDRERPVVALTGDGGLLMCAGELLTAARKKLRIIIVVFNDASLSLIEIKQQRKRYRAAGVELGSVDWRTVAEGFGLKAFVANNEAALERALDAVSGCEGPSLIDARIDRSNYARMLEAARG
jgi:acetolactate synthase I/II/III large subunit